MRPDFSKVDFRAVKKGRETFEKWEKENHIEKNWKTPEQIDVKPAYGKKNGTTSDTPASPKQIKYLLDIARQIGYTVE